MKNNYLVGLMVFSSVLYSAPKDERATMSHAIQTIGIHQFDGNPTSETGQKIIERWNKVLSGPITSAVGQRTELGMLTQDLQEAGSVLLSVDINSQDVRGDLYSATESLRSLKKTHSKFKFKNLVKNKEEKAHKEFLLNVIDLLLQQAEKLNKRLKGYE